MLENGVGRKMRRAKLSVMNLTTKKHFTGQGQLVGGGGRVGSFKSFEIVCFRELDFYCCFTIKRFKNIL